MWAIDSYCDSDHRHSLLQLGAPYYHPSSTIPLIMIKPIRIFNHSTKEKKEKKRPRQMSEGKSAVTQHKAKKDYCIR